jgi:hypothetical protein
MSLPQQAIDPCKCHTSPEFWRTAAQLRKPGENVRKAPGIDAILNSIRQRLQGAQQGHYPATRHPRILPETPAMQLPFQPGQYAIFL